MTCLMCRSVDWILKLKIKSVDVDFCIFFKTSSEKVLNVDFIENYIEVGHAAGQRKRRKNYL